MPRCVFNDIVNLFVQDIKIIHEMLQQGKTSTEISLTMGIPSSTIRTHVRNHPEIYGSKSCRNCGQIMVQPIGRKVKYFCSDRCRMAWWSNHREQVQKKTYYTLVCAHCGKEFESYGNQNRKYCSRDCYLIARFHPPQQNRIRYQIALAVPNKLLHDGKLSEDDYETAKCVLACRYNLNRNSIFR